MKMAGTLRNCPVSGGSTPSSRARCDRIATKLAPAEVPPMMNPAFGLAWRDL
jgi:hypothetical protein